MYQHKPEVDFFEVDNDQDDYYELTDVQNEHVYGGYDDDVSCLMNRVDGSEHIRWNHNNIVQ